MAILFPHKKSPYILFPEEEHPRAEDVGLKEVLLEIPNSTKKVFLGIGRFAKTIQEEIARSGASVGLTLTAPITGIREAELKGTEFEKRIARVIFGNRPLESIETRIAKAELAIKDFGQKVQKGEIDLPFIERGMEKSLGKFSEENALAFSILGIGAIIGLDFTPAGGSKKAITAIAKSKNPTVVAGILRKINVAEDLVPSASEKLAKIMNEKEVARVISRIDEIQKTTKVIKESGDRAMKDLPEVSLRLTEIKPKVPPKLPRPERVSLIFKAPKGLEITPRRARQINKMGISPEEFVPALEAQKRGKIPFPEITARALKLNSDLEDLMKIKPGDIKEPIVMRRFDMIRKGLEKDVIRLRDNYVADPIPENKRLWDEAQERLNAAYIKIEGVRSEYGRGLSAARIEDDLAVAARNLHKVRRQLTPEKQAIFDKAVAKIRLEDPVEVARFIFEFQDAKFVEKVAEFYKNSLLSAPITHIRNTSGNILFSLFDIPTRAFAGGLDIIRATIRGKPRTIYTREALRMVYSGLKAIPDAVTEAFKALRDEFYIFGTKGFESRMLLETGRMVPAIKGLKGQIIRTPYRFLGAMDLFSRTIKTAMEIDALAYRLARQEGEKGLSLVQRIEEIKRAPPAHLIDLVHQKAKRALFLEDMGGILKTIEDVRFKHPGLHFIIPFYRTPINLVREAYRLTPLRLLTARNDPWLLNPTTRMEEIARMTLGSLIGATIVWKMLDGSIEITTRAPTIPAERDLFYRLGKQPYSVRIGENWYSYREIHPFASIIHGAAKIGEAIDLYKRKGELVPEEIEREANRMITDTALYIQDLTFFQGLGNLVEAISGGSFNQGYLQIAPRYLGQLFGGFIPNILYSYQRAADPTIYSAGGFMEQIKVRVPGMQEGLIPRRDIYGQALKRPGEFWMQFLSPVKVSTETRDLVDLELDKIDVAVGYPTRTAFGEPLTDYEYDAFLQDSGARIYEALYKLMKTKKYRKLTPFEKEGKIDSVVKEARKKSREHLFGAKRLIRDYKAELLKEGYSEAEIEIMAERKFGIDLITEKIYEPKIKPGQIQPLVEKGEGWTLFPHK